MRARTLEGRVAVVAGATRGAGRGIARMLGEAGATVYCTGRSSRTEPNTSGHHRAGRPETIEETAELVAAQGGTGIAVRVEHQEEAEVAALFERVQREQGRLDVLATAITGRPVVEWKPFWELSVSEGRALVDGWIWPHVLTARYGVPLMVANRSGLVVELVEQNGVGYHGQFYFDLFETLLKRLVYSLAEELRPHGVSAVAVAPGFMRTEAILEQFGVSEANWRAAIDKPDAAQWGWARSETPCFTGRAVAALTADGLVSRKSGGIYDTGTLAREYGFTDLDGSRPDLHAWLEKQKQQSGGGSGGAVRWTIEPVSRAQPVQRKR